jgi:ankyrin repeat protein
MSIHDASAVGDIEAVKQHIAAGMDMDGKDENGMTPLFGAAFNGHKEVAELLIAAGADVNAKDEGGETPLLYAATFGHKEIAELLLANGARLISFEAYELGSIWGDEPKRSISPAQE